MLHPFSRGAHSEFFSMGNEQSSSGGGSSGARAMHPMQMVERRTPGSKDKHRKSREARSHGSSHSSGCMRHRESMSSTSSSSTGISNSTLVASSRSNTSMVSRRDSTLSIQSIAVFRGLKDESSDDEAASIGDAWMRLRLMPNRYETIDQVQWELRTAGLEWCRPIIAVDFSRANRWNGEKTFGGRNLHDIDFSGASMNPYESVISTVGQVLEPFRASSLESIPAFGFGDATSETQSCFPLFPSESTGFSSVLELLSSYRNIAPTLKCSGPRNFAPAIRKATEYAKNEPEKAHVLVIITSGSATNEADTAAAILEASKLPIAIVVVGVGDGPWDALETLPREMQPLEGISGPVFHFVDWYSTTQRNNRNPNAGFAMAALANVPIKFKTTPPLARGMVC